VKLSGNFLIVSVIESLGEAMRWSAKAASTEAISRHPDLDAVRCPCLQDVWRADRRWNIRASRVRGIFGSPLAAAEDLRVPLPLASLLRDRFLALLAHGGDKLDWSAIGQLAAKNAGEVEV
jgi:3-hydroxyisobutyrate dehydrogenase-like beta-hydroxyacid dehydrogenase